MTPLRLLVCGGRDYFDRAAVFRTLDAIRASEGVAALCHGGAPGADSIAGEWAGCAGAPVAVFRAEWERWGRRPGPRRNQLMLASFKPTAAVAFPGGPGTADMVRRCLQAGTRVLDPATARFLA